MRLGFLGDSFDIVKRSLLEWLGVLGAWSVFPMFTDDWPEDQLQIYRRILQVDLVSHEKLTRMTDRKAFFSKAYNCSTHLFLDPDTGLMLGDGTERTSLAHIYLPELLRIVKRNSDLLTMIFDQSINRGDKNIDKEGQLRAKLGKLQSEGVFGFAYVSHACFLLVGMNHDLVLNGLRIIKGVSGLPSDHFLVLNQSKELSTPSG